MSIAVGVFRDKDSIIQALQLIGGQGIRSSHIGLVTQDGSSQAYAKPIVVSGFLRKALGYGELRMREGVILTTLASAGIDMLELAGYMKAVKRGYTMLAVQTSRSLAPWVAEGMRRAGAVTATDSATQQELAELPYSHRRRFHAHRARIR